MVLSEPKKSKEEESCLTRSGIIFLASFVESRNKPLISSRLSEPWNREKES
jgi:hypothetical protein